MIMVFFDNMRVIYHEFVLEEQTVNRWYYLEVLIHLQKGNKEKGIGLKCGRNEFFFHHDNDLTHISLLIFDF